MDRERLSVFLLTKCIIPLKKPRSTSRTSFWNGGSKLGFEATVLNAGSKPKDSCSPARLSSAAGSFLGIKPLVPVGITRGCIPRKGTSKFTSPRIRCFAWPFACRSATSAARIPPRLWPSRTTSRSSASCGDSLQVSASARALDESFLGKVARLSRAAYDHIPGAELVHCGLDLAVRLVSRI